MRIKLTLAIALTAVMASAQNARHRAPRTFTTDTLMVHDPVMAVEDGVYHVFSTGNGLQHATSVDRRQWAVHAEPVLGRIPGWTHDSVPGFRRHVWAPDVIRYRGRWWLAYSCSTFGKRTSAIGLASSETLAPGAEWRDEGPLVCSREGRDNWNAIDPNFVIDTGGQPWLTFGSFWGGIQLVRLDSTMHVAAGEKPRTIARRRTDGRANPIEAPFIFRHGDYFYLFVSWDYCCRGMESTYRVAVGRSKNVAGPYLDRDGRDMYDGGGTLVLEGDKKEFEAAGHSAAYRFNGQDLFICHGYSIPMHGASILVQSPIDWDEDGWPIVSFSNKADN